MPILTSKLPAAEPFLRWAGGKRWLAAYIQGLLPRTYGRYIEPFLGGGSVFFQIAPSRAVLGDSNEELIATYRTVRSNPEGVYYCLIEWPNDAPTYYTIRAQRFRNPIRLAARFIYLNKTCWNGLYRVNRNGAFNVPYGRTIDRTVVHLDKLTAAANALRTATLIGGDFAKTLHKALPGDVVYLDPPYTALHSNNGFLRYNERLFSWADQRRLAEVALHLARKGCHVIVSNGYHKEVARLYSGFKAVAMTRGSRLAAEPAHRRPAAEALFISPSLD